MTELANVYLIKDLSRISGHSIHTIKFYIKLGLLREAGRSPQTRFRYFDETTVARLSTIRAWRKQHKSLAEVQHLLAEGSGLRAAGHDPEPTAPNPERIFTE